MARSMRKATTSKVVADTKEEIVETKEEVVAPVETKKEKKIYENDDMIPCVSIIEGKLVLIGAKTGDRYVWEGLGGVEDVAYVDLIAEVRTRGSHVFAPWFIIQDKEFLAQHPEVDKVYGGMYTPQDIEKVLTMPANQMKAYIEQMPVGAQESLQNIAMNRIASGDFDSVQRIKVLDEFFGTNLLVTLTE